MDTLALVLTAHTAWEDSVAGREARLVGRGTGWTSR
jgi:hypothetical protein